MFIDSGTVAADFIWNGLLLPIVSERVIRILKQNNIEKFSTYDIRITHKNKEIPGYKGLVILGRGGSTDPKSYIDGKIPGTDIQKIKGIFPTKWDGTDLFTLDDMYLMALATDRVKTIFKKEKVTNCKFKSAEEFRLGY